jgi:tetratricopeptide (TPR) repeat protein
MSGTSVPPTTWNIPFKRNPYFTGRESVINRLHDSLTHTQAAALIQPQGVSGLGGIGKTQTAVEYAYRYRDEYTAVLWVRADSQPVLLSEFVSLADLLDLPEKGEQDQRVVVASVQHWLREQSGWLLIFDNVENLATLNRFLPTAYQGHILLTTRATALTALAHRIELEQMPLEEGALLLLRRAGIVALGGGIEDAAASDREVALELAQLMDGLPLALDQAGAYIRETKSSLTDYLGLYRTRALDLLDKRSQQETEYPDTVATTWSLSFEKVMQADAAAASLLCLYAFLYADAIPEEFVTDGGTLLGPALQVVAHDELALNAAMKALLNFSLVQRQADERTCSVHRLVQLALKSHMDRETQLAWAKCAVLLVEHVFPAPSFNTWQRCQRYIVHAQVCSALIEEWDMLFEKAARLVGEAGAYLYDRARYAEAEQLYKQSLARTEKILGPEHSETSTCLNNLALLCYDQGKYHLAEPLYQRALLIDQKTLEPEHPSHISKLNNLALLYDAQGRYELAEPLYQQVLEIREQTLGPVHPAIANSANNLAILYKKQGKYAQAEALYQRALAIQEQALDPGHPDVAVSLLNLGELYQAREMYQQAEELAERALAIDEQAYGPKHPTVAADLNNLARLYADQGKYVRAESLYRRALAIMEQAVGPEHPSVATYLTNLAHLYDEQGRYGDAEALYQRALAIREQWLGSEHFHVADSLCSLNASKLIMRQVPVPE